MLLSSIFTALTTTVSLAAAASLVQVRDWGANPTRINMYIFVPDKLAEKPAIIVAVSRPV